MDGVISALFSMSLDIFGAIEYVCLGVGKTGVIFVADMFCRMQMSGPFHPP